MTLATVHDLRKPAERKGLILRSDAQGVRLVLFSAPERFWVDRRYVVAPKARKYTARFGSLHIWTGRRAEPVESMRVWATPILELEPVPEVAQVEDLLEYNLAPELNSLVKMPSADMRIVP